MTEFPIERRDLLRAAGAGLLGTTGVGAAQTTGTQETSGGDLVWEFTQPSGGVFSSPTVADGTVYVGSNGGNLYAVDAATGDQEWAFDTLLITQSSPTVADGTVYVGSWSEYLFAVDADSGEQEWAFNQPSGFVFSSPTVADSTVYVGILNALYAVDAATGSQEWAFTQPSDTVDSSPTVADGTVYVGSRDNNLYAVDAATGDLVWEFTQPSSDVFSSPTVADGTVYVGSIDNTLYAVDAATGNQEWAFTQPSGEVQSSPTVADGTVYVGSFDDTLYAVDAATGDLVWEFTQPSSDVFSSPTVADGTVYVGSRDNNLYAVDAATGDQEWAFTQPSDPVQSSPTVADGTVYVGSIDNTLYAVDAGVEGSSEGSRVRLRTLGHHDENVGQPPAPDPLTAQNGVAIDEQAGVGYVLEDSMIVVFETVNGGGSERRSDVFNTYPAPDGTDQGLAYGAGSLWYADAATDAYDGQILELAPDTGAVRSEINTGYDPYGLAYGDGSLWVAEVTGIPNNVYEFSPDGTQIGSFDIGGPAGSKGPQGLAYYNGSVWVGTNSALYELGPNGGVVQEINEHDGGYKGLAGISTALYGPDGDGNLTVILGKKATGDISLALAITDATAEAGGTATVTYILTNEGNAESSGLQGRIDFPPGNWQLGDSGSFTSLGPGESDSISAEVLVPESASGEYTIDGSVTDDAGNKATASGTVTVEPPGEPSWTLTAQAFQPVDGPGPLPAQPGETFRLSLVITNTGTVPGDASIQFVSASSGEHNADYYGDQFAVESHTDDGGEWFVEGWRWDENTDSGPIAPDETREPVVELAVAEDVSAGEYTFAMSGPDGAMATATVTVAPLDGTRQQKLALAGRIDDAATFDSLLTREPSTRAFQPEQEVARNSLDLLEESVPDGSLSRETAIDAANRLIWGEQLTEDVLQYTGDATITTDVTELPDDLNIAQQTAGPLLRVVVSLLLQAQAASKIVSSISQKLPGAVSINPDQIEGVANKLLDIALGFKSETDDVPADAPDTTDPTTLLEDLQPEVATIVEEIENGVTTSVDAVLSTIDAVVQPFIDVAAGTLRVFLEHIALSGTVTEGVDAGLSGAVTNLHSALRPEAIASGGLAGSQSQAEEAYTEGGAGLIQTAVEAADVLDGFGTQEKLRDSTELAVNVLKLEPEEIDVTTIVEFAREALGLTPGIYGEALDLGLGIGFMLNLHASHSNAHTGIINGE